MSLNPRGRLTEMPPLQRLSLTAPRGPVPAPDPSGTLLVGLGAVGRRPSPGISVGEKLPVASPTRKIGKLRRRETTGRLLDLGKPTPVPIKSPVGSTSLPETLTQVAALPSVSNPRLAVWKPTKLFSRTMTSNDLLKGIKKPPQTTSEEEPQASAAKGSFKTRLSSLRRKPSGGEVVIKVESEETSPPMLRKVSTSEEAARGPATTPPRKKSEDEGIVCKKEDLISLIRKAAKKQVAINKAEAARKKLAVRVTRSASLERTHLDPISSEEPTCTSAPMSKEPSPKCSFEVEKVLPSPPLKSPLARSPLAKTSPVSFETLAASTQREEKETVESPTPTTCEPEEEGGSPNKETKRKASKVEWDDNSFVDAMLLGGAIEAFLKGSMGGSEKRVSFKKN